MHNKKKINKKRLFIKMFLCLVYLIIITILFACSYQLFQEKNKAVPWQKVENVEERTFIDIYKMSEKFAYYKENNIGLHFIIEKEATGLWHTFIIAINEGEYAKYKEIIDYTYERTTKIPEPIRVYGYPVIVDEKLKSLAIKNLPNFVPAENEVKITTDNYETYLTNSYLDTTKGEKESFNTIIFISLLLLFIVIALLIFTIFNKDKIVDNIDEKLEKDIKKTKKLLKKNKHQKN